MLFSNKQQNNFFKVKNIKKFSKIQKNLNSGLNQTGHKILRFRKVNKQKKYNLLSDLPLFNFNLIQLKISFFCKTQLLSNWVQAENLNFIEDHFVNLYQKKLQGLTLKKTIKRYNSKLNLNWFKPTASLIFSLKFIIKVLQFYFFKTPSSNFNSLMLAPSYWNSFDFFKTPLNILELGNYLYEGESQNFRFSQKPSKGSFLIDSKDNFSLLTLPSQKTVWLDKSRTFGILKNDSLKNLPKKKKASSRLLHGKKPTVRGKAMNVFDHPNGGFKHSSKILKTFKGKIILK